MSSSEEEGLEGLDKEQKEKVKKLLEKDAASGRRPAGFWQWVVALLGGGMVLFYLYTAGLASVATQYHRGVYVLVTYVLVFLLYPTGSRWLKYPLAALAGILLAGFSEWLKFKQKMGASASQVDSSVKALEGEVDKLKGERQALVQRIQNLEAIIASEQWETLGSDKELAQATMAQIELPEPDRDEDADEVARIARRLRQ